MNVNLLSTNSDTQSSIENENTNVFRSIHYLGSKLRILDFIEKTVDELDDSNGHICDLFAGTGSVSRKLAQKRPVTSVDIQEYSRVICSALLNPVKANSLINNFIDKCHSSTHSKSILWCVEPLSKYENQCINEALSGKPESLCDFIEHSSLITYELNGLKNGLKELIAAKDEVLERLKAMKFLNNAEALSVRHMGGIYFSFIQSVQIDIILHYIEELPIHYKDVFLASLLSSVSDSVNTIGKHFAQPIRPRDVHGKPKANLGKQVYKDRAIDVFFEMSTWLKKYMSIPQYSYTNHVLKMDYSEALDTLRNDTKIVYADPPYTRDHYSRFYHVLETLCLRDNPNISTMVTNGEKQISRGIYREYRHQSPFCIKSQAPRAFETLIQKVRKIDAALVISYSPYDETKNSHSRTVTIRDIKKIAYRYYPKIEILSVGSFKHSKLTNVSKHLDASKEAEVLIVCKI